VIIVMNQSAAPEAIKRVVAEIERMGNQAHLSEGKFRTIIGAIGEEGTLDQNHIASLEGVEKVVPIMKPYKLASREFHEDDSVVDVGGGKVPAVKIGGPHAACIAGPCAVENEKMLHTIARAVREGGVQAADQPVFLPGPWRNRPPLDARLRR
jgi:3-deoxy-7-phosphoheptulonate synthase